MDTKLLQKAVTDLGYQDLSALITYYQHNIHSLNQFFSSSQQVQEWAAEDVTSMLDRFSVFDTLLTSVVSLEQRTNPSSNAAIRYAETLAHLNAWLGENEFDSLQAFQGEIDDLRASLSALEEAGKGKKRAAKALRSTLVELEEGIQLSQELEEVSQLLSSESSTVSEEIRLDYASVLELLASANVACVEADYESLDEAIEEYEETIGLLSSAKTSSRRLIAKLNQTVTELRSIFQYVIRAGEERLNNIEAVSSIIASFDQALGQDDELSASDIHLLNSRVSTSESVSATATSCVEGENQDDLKKDIQPGGETVLKQLADAAGQSSSTNHASEEGLSQMVEGAFNPEGHNTDSLALILDESGNDSILISDEKLQRTEKNDAHSSSDQSSGGDKPKHLDNVTLDTGSNEVMLEEDDTPFSPMLAFAQSLSASTDLLMKTVPVVVTATAENITTDLPEIARLNLSSADEGNSLASNADEQEEGSIAPVSDAGKTKESLYPDIPQLSPEQGDSIVSKGDVQHDDTISLMAEEGKGKEVFYPEMPELSPEQGDSMSSKADAQHDDSTTPMTEEGKGKGVFYPEMPNPCPDQEASDIITKSIRLTDDTQENEAVTELDPLLDLDSYIQIALYSVTAYQQAQIDPLDVTHHSLTEIVYGLQYLKSSMPDSAEKTLDFLKHYYNFCQLDKTVNEPIPINNDIPQILIHLERQLMNEGVADDEMLTLINSLRDDADQSDKKLAPHQVLKKIIRKIRTIDFEKLIYLASKTMQAAEQLKDKNVVLLVGGTGVGKSTTIHYLAGSTIEEVYVDGLKHLAPTNITNPNLEGCTTSPFSWSETRFIHPVHINWHGENIVLCDTPGFEDTEGPEMDIANGLGIVRAVRLAQSVKLVFLISRPSMGDKLSGIFKTALTLGDFLPSVGDELASLTYLFTKFHPSESEDIHYIIQHGRRHLPPDLQHSARLQSILSDICEKTNSGVDILNPTDGDPSGILSRIVSSGSIFNPEQKFRNFTSCSSLAALREQLSKHEDSIKKALERLDIPVVRYKLTQLSTLSDLLEISECRRVYQRCSNQVRECIHALQLKVQSLMSFCLNRGNKNFHDDLVLVGDALLALCQLENIRSRFHPELDNLFEFSTLIINTSVLEFKGRVRSAFLSYENYEESYTNYLKLKLFIECIVSRMCETPLLLPLIQSSVAELRSLEESIQQAYDAMVDNSYTLLKGSQFRGYHLHREKIDAFLLYYSANTNDDASFTLSELDNSAVKLFRGMVSSFLEQIVLSNDNHSQWDWGHLCNDLREYFAFINLCEGSPYIPADLVFTLNHQLKNHLIEFTDKCFETTVQSSEMTIFALKQLIELRTLQDVESITNITYFQRIRSLSEMLVCKCEEVLSYIELLKNNPHGVQLPIDYSRLSENVNSLSQARALNVLEHLEINGMVESIKAAFDSYSEVVISDVETIQSIPIHTRRGLLILSRLLTISNVFSQLFDISSEMIDFIKQMQSQLEALMIEVHNRLVSQPSTEILSEFYDQSHFLYLLMDVGMPGYDTRAESFLDETVKQFKKTLVYLLQPFSGGSVSFFTPEMHGADESKLESLHKLVSLLLYLDNLSGMHDKISSIKVDQQSHSRTPIEKLQADLKSQLYPWFNENETGTIDLYYQYLDGLISTFQDAGSIDEMGSLLKVLTCLRDLDALPQFDFASKVVLLQDKFSEFALQEVFQLRVSVAARDFPSILQLISSLRKSGALSNEEISAELIPLRNLFTEISIRLGNQQDHVRFAHSSLSQIRSYLHDLAFLREIVEVFIGSEELLEDTISAQLDGHETRFNDLLMETVSFTELSLYDGQFYSTYQVISLLKSVIEENSGSQYSTTSSHRLIQSQKNRLEESMQSEINEMYTALKDASLSYCLTQPVDMFISELSILAEFDEDYKEMHNNLVRSIQSKIELMIDDLGEDVSSESFEKQFSAFKNTLANLPAIIKDRFSKVLQNYEEKVQFHQNKVRSNITKIAEGNAISDVIVEFLGTVRHGDQSKSMMLDKVLQIQFERNNQEIALAHSYDQSEKSLVLALVGMKYCNHLISSLSEPSHEYSIISKAAGWSEEWKREVVRQLSESLCSLDMALSKGSIDAIHKISKYVRPIAYLLDFSKENTVVIELFDDSLINSIQSTIEKIHVYCAEQLGLFEIHLANHNTEMMLKILDGFHETREAIDALPSDLDETYHTIMLQELRESIDTGNAKSLDQMLFTSESAMSEDPSVREDFFSGISEQYVFLKELSICTKHKDRSGCDDIESVFLGQRTSLTKQVVDLEVNLGTLAERLSLSDHSVCDDLNHQVSILKSFIKCIDDAELKQLSERVFNKLNIYMEHKGETFKSSILSLYSIDDLQSSLIALKQVSFKLPSYYTLFNRKIDSTLLSLSIDQKGMQQIATLGLTLRQVTGDGQDAAMRLLNEHSVFEGFSVSLRNKKTLSFTATDVIEKMGGVDLNHQTLFGHYQEFEVQYRALVDNGLSNTNSSLNFIAENANNLAGSLEPMRVDVDKLITLMAHIFAYWTLKNSLRYLDMMKTADDVGMSSTERLMSYLMQPHPAQVISIFRLLGFDISGEKTIQHHLIQIPTGEGKSVALAVTATLIVMLGYRVDCVCYSSYLSQRDYNAFEELFNVFKVESSIRYGTFNELCEHFINQEGDIRQAVVKAIEGKDAAQNAYSETAPAVLLIDEVDVFFSTSFYGNFYRPLAQLKHDTVSDLIRYVYTQKNDIDDQLAEKIKMSTQYKECLSVYSGWEFLLEQAIHEMILDLKSLDSHKYEVYEGRIGYLEQDSINFNINYGYKTVFAYLHENEKGCIPDFSLNNIFSLILDSGIYSYAEIPKTYHCIMGLTGTLDSLSDAEHQIISDYGIQKFTYMPSVYGENKCRFSSESSNDMVIVDVTKHHVAIAAEIIKRRDSDPSIKRSVMVFFESKDALEKFYASTALSDLKIKSKTKIISESLSPDERDALISQSANLGAITLLTREFGRGVNFQCYDDRLLAAGGVHVISAFFSDSLSEEIQIKGRTARQGNNGSYSMVLNNIQLERFGIDITQFKDNQRNGVYYKAIHPKRVAFYEDRYVDSMKYVGDIQNEHVLSIQFLQDALFQNDVLKTKEFLQRRSSQKIKLLKASSVSRTLILLDATGSMARLIHKTKSTVKTMLNRAFSILQDSSYETRVEVKIAAYRNYDCDSDMILQMSEWESDAINLESFLSTISATGGTWLEEAVEIALKLANEESNKNPIDQVILIADAPPNTREQVTEGRGMYHGEDYWRKLPFFASKTYFEDELMLLTRQNVPVHAFYVDNNARDAFQFIASTSHGECQLLDINSDAGAVLLTDLITKRILSVIGGDELVTEYERRYIKGYTAQSDGFFSMVSSSLQTDDVATEDFNFDEIEENFVLRA